MCSNSVGQSPHHRAMVLQKIIKRRGERPPPKRERKTNQLAASNKLSSSIDCGTNIHDHDSTSFFMHTFSKFWQAHASGAKPGGLPSSSISIITRSSNDHPSNAGSALGMPLRPAKRARKSEPSFKCAPACKGSCPAVWTIESYCEHCHG